MASLADNLKTRRASELEHRGRPKIDLNRAKDSVGKLDRAVASLADLLPRMDEGGKLAYDESGNIVGGYDPEGQVEKAINWLMPMGSVGEAVDTGKGIAQGVLKTFGGVGAKTADKEALAAAESLEKSGADMRDVWRQTGWYRAPWDGKWRFEIDDSGRIAPDMPDYSTARDLLAGHNRLFDAYPDIGDIKYNDVDLGSTARFDPQLNIIEGSIERMGPSSTLHELQHVIQGKEKFASGGSAALFRPRMSDDDAYTAYRRLAGEAEARLVQDRLPLTAAQRREQYPLDGLAAMLAREGIDPGDNFSNLITRYGDGPAMAIDPDKLSALRSGLESNGITMDAYPNRAGDMVTLSKFVVPPEQRGQGLGTAALNDLAALADEGGATVALSPSKDFGATSVARLKDFYRRAGFVENKGKNKDFSISESMYRTPRK